MSRFTLHQGDSREVLKALAENSVDAIVCDPPYHLTTGKKGGTGPASVNPSSPAGRSMIGTGFMGMTWDGGEVAHDPALWAEALRVAKPGAYLLAFGGTRTFHRLACAIEDAGWELRDTDLRGHTPRPEDCPWLMGWIFGEGFPKGTDKSKIPEPWRGQWNTALKPAWEPIVCARKPLAGTLAENLLAHGTGAMNIDGCRIAIDPDADASQLRSMQRNQRASGDGWGMSTVAGDEPTVVCAAGRWPANLVHDGSDGIMAVFPREAGAAAPVTVRNGDKFRGTYGAFAGNIDEAGSTFHADSGSAARFFYCSKTAREDRNEGCEHLQRKPLLWSSGEQNPGSFQAEGTDRTSPNFHPTVKPTDLMRYLCRLVTPGGVSCLIRSWAVAAPARPRCWRASTSSGSTSALSTSRLPALASSLRCVWGISPHSIWRQHDLFFSRRNLSGHTRQRKQHCRKQRSSE